MRRLPPLSARPRSRTIWPAAVAGTIALALSGENAAHAAPPAPTLSPVPPAPRTLGAPVLASATPVSYTVQPGDTVWAIARAHGLDTAGVLAANGLDASSIIRPGQVLALVPAPVAPASTEEATVAPAPSGRTHEVRPGDTVSAIASAGGVSTDAVLAANGLTRASIIYPGEILQIPSGAVPVEVVASTGPVTAPGLDGEQSENARLIIRIGRESGVSDRGIAIALGTAMQESWLRNLDWGDRDSLGLFQQRPSTGWGTPEQILDRERATRVFYGGTADPNGTATRGLLDIPGWEGMAYADAAQAVQISAYPDRYAQWESPATAWISVLG
ncbi:MAG: peptidoglycan-binding protein LysM [Microbacterium sp. 71-36]|uniref:LysM peptidoglycan-binding domain-containing protein n=1 Tax=unclassified Microbacterium TaxID=2609290 RepID=UPI00086ACAB8|nr:MULTISPECIES: LysM domain-containing protein [unclassified Microbacterium]MBN9212267.1 LysM peptidoglycan-binding domain-containing protein [Microbacterium sp.]ODT37325.1 MAG: peptidoglycan-binding protein LysM [Microbacterium sp. SCN 71-17]OJV75707.1 MAG: peptidoglycan-binding protein LysM [Microbacterium sp. 71-36]